MRVPVHPQGEVIEHSLNTEQDIQRGGFLFLCNKGLYRTDDRITEKNNEGACTPAG